jgi:hypothetical protein
MTSRVTSAMVELGEVHRVSTSLLAAGTKQQQAAAGSSSNLAGTASPRGLRSCGVYLQYHTFQAVSLMLLPCPSVPWMTRALQGDLPAQPHTC